MPLVIHGLLFSFCCLPDNRLSGTWLSSTLCINNTKGSNELSKLDSVNSSKLDENSCSDSHSSLHQASALKLELSRTVKNDFWGVL